MFFESYTFILTSTKFEFNLSLVAENFYLNDEFDKVQRILKNFKKEDILDNSLIKIIKKRTKLVDKVLELKKFKNQIVDNDRIKIILEQIRKKSIKNKIDPKITNRIWINMIRAYIDYEKRNFKKK